MVNIINLQIKKMIITIKLNTDVKIIRNATQEFYSNHLVFSIACMLRLPDSLYQRACRTMV